MEQFGGDKWIEEGLNTDFKKGINGDVNDIEKRTFAF